MPPGLTAAAFAVTVLLVMVNVPLTLAIPAAWLAVLLLTVLLVNVAAAGVPCCRWRRQDRRRSCRTVGCR
jgi:hypothetical protein